jgi:hypothetical protein
MSPSLELHIAALKRMNGASRVWLYTANRLITNQEQEQLIRSLHDFLQGWNAHGAGLVSGGGVFYNAVLVLAVDESKLGASGCSIDSSVRWVQEIGTALGIDFFNRMLVVHGGHPDWKLDNVAHFWALRKSGQIDDDHLVVNTLCKSLDEWHSEGVVPFRRSWHKDAWGR